MIKRGRGIAPFNYPTAMNLGGDPTQALIYVRQFQEATKDETD